MGGLAVLTAASAHAAISCQREISADVVAFDKPLMYNRLGAGNVNGMMYALRRDVVNVDSLLPLKNAASAALQGAAVAGRLDLRGDKRHRPLVLRVRKGDCLTISFQNLLTPGPNPFNAPKITPAGQQFNPPIVDDQTAERRVGIHVSGLQVVDTIKSDGSNVGANGAAGNGLVAPDGSVSYKLYAAKEGVFVLSNPASTFGSDGNMGNTSNGLFGQVIVEPTGAESFRGQVFEEELRLARTGTTADGHPIINYDATYPNDCAGNGVWCQEGKAGLPVVAMMTLGLEIVHSEINAINAFRDANGNLGAFPASTYPLESVGKRNPTVPNRLEAFRDYASVFHDEAVNVQAFPGFFLPAFAPDPVMPFVLEGVKDAFMINYGSGGIGSEIIANRLRVGPMHDCLDCAYEEFFLTSFTVGDPALTVDIPANEGLELCGLDAATGALVNCPPAAAGPKANYVIGAEDPSNVHHSYTGDFVKFRNTHNGKEQHVFHLHNHQWLYNPNDDNSNYLDAQGIGPGVGYTYEINFGGSGNRNKSAGDAIFHCHFYPHFAQGMWYHWRHHDVLESGTILAATPNHLVNGFAVADGFHSARWALANTTPAIGARAYPDGEIVRGTPIPAVVPLPRKPMAPVPGRVTVQAKLAGDGVTVLGSNAKVLDRSVNPGYPFWIAGIEDSVGQRPPTPPLDMVNADDVARARAADPTLFANLSAAQADGWDGGLPRHTLQGYADGGVSAFDVPTPIDFSKVVEVAKPVYFPEEGTDLEQLAMAFHALRCHDSFLPDGTPANCSGVPATVKGISGKVTSGASVASGGFVTNGGGGPVVGAPFHNPCIDDQGRVLSGAGGSNYNFFSGETLSGLGTHGSSVFNSATPRIYKGSFMQYDAVITKTGYHYPQQRIVALWEDVGPVIAKNKPGEPLVFRMNTFDCTVYHNSNLVPENYEIDDYQVRTPTDVIGQHIHLPKWDLTTTDGAANGWNYEDGTLSPGAVRERIAAINAFTSGGGAPVAGTGVPAGFVVPNGLEPAEHPFFASVASALGGQFPEEWLGARTTTQRWFADPVVNTEGVDRGLGIIFTHDHYGPSTHQQIGLYSTLLIEPAASQWAHNETGTGLGCTTTVNTSMPTGSVTPNTTPCRWDGGPTSWQAAIMPPSTASNGSTVQAQTLDPYREFYFEFSDFQHAYEPGVYVGTGQDGLPLPGTGPHAPVQVANAGNAAFDGAPGNAFRFAINPPMREQIAPVFPDLVVELAGGLDPRCPSRPCPQAIDVQDPGMLSVNYRAEPIGLRIFDPDRLGPDGKRGTQANGLAGDLAFALQSRTDRAIGFMNVQPVQGTTINGTVFPPPINAAGVGPGDPFTPMVRTFAGDLVRVKIQAGGHEEEHNASIHGLKWLQAGSGHGKAPNSGWRNAQAAGISEQFTLSTPIVPLEGNTPRNLIDYAWSVDGGNDGWWSGMWGILRAYEQDRADLAHLPGTVVPVVLDAATRSAFNGVCPTGAPVRNYDVTAVAANEVLPQVPTAFGVSIQDIDPNGHVGATPANNRRTLVYNHRRALVGGQVIPDPADPAATITLPTHRGPLHDPTAMLYVMTGDLQTAPANAVQRLLCRLGGVQNPLCPVVLNPARPIEPLVLRAQAGDCIQVTLRNRLPLNSLDLPTYSTIQGVVKRDRFDPEGSTTFQTNLFQASGFAGLHPQLVAYDASRADGVVVGENAAGVLNPFAGTAPPRVGVEVVRWYAGDIAATKVGNQYHLTATPVEFGGANLMPADKIKQGAKSLVGTLVIEPAGSTWAEDLTVFDHQDGAGTRPTRTQARLNPTSATTEGARDFSIVLTKGLTQYYADSMPVEHMNGEGVGIPEDSQEASGMALNYGIEPAWFRFGLVPQAPFGFCGGAAGCYGSVANAGDYYSNALAVPGVGGTQGNPVTPVLLAKAGQETRIHITNPYGTTRGSTFSLHGHVWQRDPYVCAGAKDGLAGRCKAGQNPAAADYEVGSPALGVNPLAFAQGGQESWNAPSHFEVFLPGKPGPDGINWPPAGGDNAVKGDYLFRDHASFGNASGVWGVMRVQ